MLGAELQVVDAASSQAVVERACESSWIVSWTGPTPLLARVEHPSFHVVEAQVDAQCEAGTVQVLVRPNGGYAFRVEDTAGEACSGARVSVECLEHAGPYAIATGSDVTSLQLVPTCEERRLRRSDLVATDDGYVYVSEELLPRLGALQIVAEYDSGVGRARVEIPAGDVVGPSVIVCPVDAVELVVLEAGAPACGVRLDVGAVLASDDKQRTVRARWSANATTDERGVLRLSRDLLPACIRPADSSAWRFDHRRNDVFSDARGPVLLVQETSRSVVTLERVERIRGVVEVAVGDQSVPAAGARLEVLIEDPYKPELMRTSLRADERGNFEFRFHPRSTKALEASLDGVGALVRVELTPGMTREPMRVVIPASETLTPLRGVVRTAAGSPPSGEIEVIELRSGSDGPPQRRFTRWDERGAFALLLPATTRTSEFALVARSDDGGSGAVQLLGSGAPLDAPVAVEISPTRRESIEISGASCEVTYELVVECALDGASRPVVWSRTPFACSRNGAARVGVVAPACAAEVHCRTVGLEFVSKSLAGASLSSGSPVTLELPPRPVLRGALVSVESTAGSLDGVRVGCIGIGVERRYAPVRADNTFDLSVPRPGEYYVFAYTQSSSGAKVLGSSAITVAPDGADVELLVKP